MPTSGNSAHAAFRDALRAAAAGLKRPLPWIDHPDPWAVLVSEVMLQQTQAARVLECWRRFLDRFPTPTACADSSLADVLVFWSGLGYNRRAKALHDAARLIRDDFGGVVPSQRTALLSLPGVGEYTANAVLSFAFNTPVAVLDTNVGRVLARAVENRSLRPREARAVAQSVLPRDGVAAFNQAMLDLGAEFCRAAPRCPRCPLADVCHWHREGGDDPAPRSASVSRPQSRFEGSDRQMRGQVLEVLRASSSTDRRLGASFADVDSARLDRVLEGLVRDGLIERLGSKVVLAGALDGEGASHPRSNLR